MHSHLRQIGARAPRTPWGTSQHSRVIAPGITLHETAGHGGFHLDRPRQTELAKKFSFPTFAGGPWYEEDEDVAAVIIAFPQHFSAENLRGAVITARRSTASDRWADVNRYLDEDPEGQQVVLLALGREAETADAWRITRVETAGDDYSVTVQRGTKMWTFDLSVYPATPVFSDEEVQQRVLGIIGPDVPGPRTTVGGRRPVGGPRENGHDPLAPPTVWIAIPMFAGSLADSGDRPEGMLFVPADGYHRALLDSAVRAVRALDVRRRPMLELDLGVVPVDRGELDMRETRRSRDLWPRELLSLKTKDRHSKRDTAVRLTRPAVARVTDTGAMKLLARMETGRLVVDHSDGYGLQVTLSTDASPDQPLSAYVTPRMAVTEFEALSRLG